VLDEKTALLFLNVEFGLGGCKAIEIKTVI
jgi:hypothetical protein